VQTCSLRRSDKPSTGNATNLLLAAGKAFGQTVLIVAPDQSWQGNRLFGISGSTCGAVGLWDLMPPPPGGLFHVPRGVELTKTGRLIMSVIAPDGTMPFYRFESLQNPLTPPTATSPIEGDGVDITIGSGF
jgi:hypothetical protein